MLITILYLVRQIEIKMHKEHKQIFKDIKDLIVSTRLGYRTEEEHQALESFADRLWCRVDNLEKNYIFNFDLNNMNYNRFKNQINMGLGKQTERDMQYLRDLLEESFTIISGIQQPLMSTDKPLDNQDEQLVAEEMRLEDIAKEIYLALTGKTIIKDEDTND